MEIEEFADIINSWVAERETLKEEKLRLAEEILKIKFYGPMWIDSKDRLPEKDGPIYFISTHPHAEPEIGIAAVESKVIILRKTDIGFDEIKAWYPLPTYP